MQPQKFKTQKKAGKPSSDMHGQWLSEETRQFKFGILRYGIVPN